MLYKANGENLAKKKKKQSYGNTDVTGFMLPIGAASVIIRVSSVSKGWEQRNRNWDSRRMFTNMWVTVLKVMFCSTNTLHGRKQGPLTQTDGRKSGFCPFHVFLNLCFLFYTMTIILLILRDCSRNSVNAKDLISAHSTHHHVLFIYPLNISWIHLLFSHHYFVYFRARQQGASSSPWTTVITSLVIFPYWPSCFLPD